MKILFINAQAISTAIKDIVNVVNKYSVDIVCINETFQDVNKKLTFLNWKVFDKPRVGRKGGGVAIFLNTNSDKFIALESNKPDNNEYESVGVEITTD